MDGRPEDVENGRQSWPAQGEAYIHQWMHINRLIMHFTKNGDIESMRMRVSVCACVWLWVCMNDTGSEPLIRLLRKSHQM